MKQEFVMRGQTASGEQEVLNFSGHTKGYAYRLVEFQIFPSTNIGFEAIEAVASLTTAKTAENPQSPNFTNAGLIATAVWTNSTSSSYQPGPGHVVINDTFLITQDLILKVVDTTSSHAVNWQCKFVSEKMNSAEEAVANFKQFTIFDE